MMAKIVSKDEVIENSDFYVEEMINGKIFIYPTDTLLGIGCNAKLADSIKRIKEIKKRREDKPCSIIAPNFGWIENACEVSKENFGFMKEKLPGPYTFVLKVKDDSFFSHEVNLGKETVGIRIPDNWFIDMIRKAHIPFVTTSVNFSGEESAKKIGDISEELRISVDYIIDDVKSTSGKPSTIIDLTKNPPQILER